MTRLLLTIILAFLAVGSQAQRKGVIVSMESGIPVREVKIFTNTNQVVETNWRGEFFIKDRFTSVTITHPNFVSLTLNLYEMNDTIELLPKFHTLDEVIVYGKRRITFDVKKVGEDAKYYAPPSSGFGFDFFSLFTKRKGLNAKQKKRHDEIIRTY